MVKNTLVTLIFQTLETWFTRSLWSVVRGEGAFLRFQIFYLEFESPNPSFLDLELLMDNWDFDFGHPKQPQNFNFSWRTWDLGMAMSETIFNSQFCYVSLPTTLRGEVMFSEVSVLLSTRERVGISHPSPVQGREGKGGRWVSSVQQGRRWSGTLDKRWPPFHPHLPRLYLAGVGYPSHIFEKEIIMSFQGIWI